MRDYIRRFLIVGIMTLCVILLFFGINHFQADTVNVKDLTSNWMWPSDGVITDSFGTRQGHHKGIDIAAPPGSSIYAVDNGVVSKSYYSDTYGNVVFIKHDNHIETVYAHLQERAVQEGGQVQQGDVIGKMGNTGDSSGVHLHFEVHLSEWTFDKTNAINPMLALEEVEVGQAVAAIQKNQPEQVIETSARLGTQVIDDVKNQQSDSRETQQTSTEQSALVKRDHIVQVGETLWSIANKYHSSVRLIQLQNGLQNNQIQVGQKLTIPGAKADIYVVQQGDTLTAIAEKTDISVARLTELNDLTGDLIMPQQKLTLRE